MPTGDVALTAQTQRGIGEAIERWREADRNAGGSRADAESRRGQRKRRAGRVSIATMVVIEIRCQGRSSGREVASHGPLRGVGIGR